MAKLSVRVTPRASADSLSGPDAAGVVHIRVTAVPTDGQANEAVTKLLAKALGLPPRDVVLLSGATSRNKVFDIALLPQEVRARLAGGSPPLPQRRERGPGGEGVLP